MPGCAFHGKTHGLSSLKADRSLLAKASSDLVIPINSSFCVLNSVISVINVITY